MSKKIKNLGDRIKDLERGLKALKNANNHYVESKDDSYLLTIESQARGLVATGGRHTNPLLLGLSKELNIPIYIYSYPEQKKEAGITFGTIIGRTWSSSEKSGFCKYELLEWLNVPVYFTDTTKEFKSRNQFIKDLSNNDGGTHYSNTVQHSVDTLERIKISNCENNSVAVLLDIAEAIFWAGNKLVLQYKYNNIKDNYVMRRDAKDKQLEEIECRIKKHDLEFSKAANRGMNVIMQGFE